MADAIRNLGEMRCGYNACIRRLRHNPPLAGNVLRNAIEQKVIAGCCRAKGDCGVARACAGVVATLHLATLAYDVSHPRTKLSQPRTKLSHCGTKLRG